jgi:urocanate hydratase
LAHDPASETNVSLQIQACSFYFALTRSPLLSAIADRSPNPGEDPSLGGKLLYAGELDAPGRAMVIAGNVAGCATLSATADATAQKQSIREGVVDFLVNSLDEALRILKNEIRQRKSVAVCVGAAPASIEREMMERGLQPDLVFAGTPDHLRAMPEFGAGSHDVHFSTLDEGTKFLSWRIAQAPARWMPKLDAIVLESLPAHSWGSRWIRLSPRYMGRFASGERVVYCDDATAEKIAANIASAVKCGDIGVEVFVSLSGS